LTEEVKEGGFLWVVLDLGKVSLAESSVMKLMKRDKANNKVERS
jgi:hypothetical protein